MAGRDPGVIVRRAHRFDVVLPASVRIADEHADLVRFGPRAGDREGWAEGDLMDVGAAGAGLPADIWRETMVRVHEGITPVPLPMREPAGATQTLDPAGQGDPVGNVVEQVLRDIFGGKPGNPPPQPSR